MKICGVENYLWPFVSPFDDVGSGPWGITCRPLFWGLMCAGSDQLIRAIIICPYRTHFLNRFHALEFRFIELPLSENISLSARLQLNLFPDEARSFLEVRSSSDNLRIRGIRKVLDLCSRANNSGSQSELALLLHLMLSLLRICGCCLCIPPHGFISAC